MLTKKTFLFPKDFLWGTATAAHQVEGNNRNSDWWEWENEKKSHQKWPLESSGIACDFYNRYEEDFDLCQKMNNNAVRFSVEWARIESKQGKFNENEIKHYQNVLRAARKRGLKVFLTLQHNTNPIWFARQGGWANMHAPEFFVRYAEMCVQKFSHLVDFFLTVNEPDGNAFVGYLIGRRYPGKHNPFAALLAEINFHRAHNGAYKIMKKFSNKPVGIVKNLGWYEAESENSFFLDRWLAKFCLFITCDLPFLFIKKNLDFIGYNYYFTIQFSFLVPRTPPVKTNDMGWPLYAAGLEKMLLYLQKYRLPIYITENGLADAKDSLRKEFLYDHLLAVWNAIQKGADVRSYLHWTLMDNFEWNYGYAPCFGLVEIDRKNNLKRLPRPSYYYFSEICKNNKLIPY